MVFISSREEDRLVEQYGVDYDVIDSYKRYLSRAENKNYNASRGRTACSDSQRQKTYDAENKFMRKHGKMGQIDLATAERFAESIFYSEEWKIFGNEKRAAPRVPTIKVQRMRHSGLAGYSSIKLHPVSGMNLYILLHELAHTAGHRHHDVSFRICLVAFVSRFNRQLGRELRNCFKEQGLKMTMPKQKTVQDFGTWLKKYQHMQKVRMARP